MRPRTLKNAPIKEAIIDIRLDRSGLDIEKLHILHKEISADYPEVKNRYKRKGHLVLPAGKPAQIGSDDVSLLGLAISSKDKSQVVQFRIDGFTFSRLEPYQTWKKFSGEAERLWNIYKKNAASDSIITRIAVRFINSIQLPVPINDLASYLRSPPNLPKSLSKLEIREFLNRIVSIDSETGIASIITQAMSQSEDQSKNTQDLLLDIDVFKEVELQLENMNIWKMVKELRVMKNRIFFDIITPKVVQLCE